MSPGLSLVLVAVLIGANGLFVAAEFGLVAARRGVIEEAAAAGDRRAVIARRELEQLSFVLSSAQFGITATSLVVGFLAEDAFGGVLVRPLLDALDVPGGSQRAIAITAAFLLSTVLQMLLGELAPKNLAIAVPERTSLALAGYMRAFGIVFGPIIRVFDHAAAVVSERVFRIELAEERLGGHSTQDLARIISASRQEGSFSELQGELLERAVELGDRRVHEVMIPRPDVVFLPAAGTIDGLRSAARTTGHSRFPVSGETDDDLVGTVHIKDVLRVPSHDAERVTIGELAVDALVVPESERLRRLLGQLRAERRTFAVVVDEYGGVAGIVTVEDVMEELVGEIEDEFDTAAGPVRRVGAGRFLVRGSVRVDTIARVIGALRLPEGDFETVAGFVIDQLGHIPEEGETVEHDGWEFTVTLVHGVRVAELRIRRLPDDGASAQGGGHA